MDFQINIQTDFELQTEQFLQYSIHEILELMWAVLYSLPLP